jgi:pantoate--beta-alanine ligase
MNRPAAPRLITGIAELREAVRAARRQGKRIGLVPTMGALHAGHVSLVAASCRECQFTIVTIFVNPLQFAPHEDFNKYPRTLEADLKMLAGEPVDVVFAPDRAEDIVNSSQATFVEVRGAAEPLEGKSRPSHFRGVATIVLKLFNLAEPDVAYFGEKDFQQAAVIQQMVRDLNLDIEIRVMPIVRESDGLAMSSRNRYLDPEARKQALSLNRSLARAAELVAAGERHADKIVAAMRAVFATSPDVQLDYLVLVDPETFAPVTRIERPTLAAVAAKVGSTRLIDNRMLEPG